MDERINSRATIDIGVWANTIAHIPNGSSPIVLSRAAGHSPLDAKNAVSIPLVTAVAEEVPKNS